MARPIRIEYPGAYYHVSMRGDRGQNVYGDGRDGAAFLNLLAKACARYRWRCHAYCLLPDHYRLLLEMRDGGLARGMHYLNSAYSQLHQRKHGRVGRLFQGRYKAVLVERGTYFYELARDIALAPLHNKRAQHAKEWPWSSYRATAGLAPPHHCLTIETVLAGFSGRGEVALRAYQQFVSEGLEQPSPWRRLTKQIYLGSETFMREMRRRASPYKPSRGVLQANDTTDSLRSLDEYAHRYKQRDRAMAAAYASGYYSLKSIGIHFGVSQATVSRAVSRYEKNR